MFYPRLRDLKEDCDITQSTVAEIIGMSAKQYARYERGEIDIPLCAAVKLAKYYKVSLDYIAGITNDKRGLNRSDLSKDDEELLKKFHALSDGGKHRVRERIEVLLEEQEH